MIYAGIGSRETPKEVLDFFEFLGGYFARQGDILRSGGAYGADTAFETGCSLENGIKEIYLPWSGFNGNNSNLIVKDEKAFEIAKIHHPYWSNLKQVAKKLQARNSHQVLGLDLNTPCDLIICYTKNKGGTQQALRIAKEYSIKVFNAYEYNNIDDFKDELWKYYVDLKVEEAKERKK